MHTLRSGLLCGQGAEERQHGPVLRSSEREHQTIGMPSREANAVAPHQGGDLRDDGARTAEWTTAQRRPAVARLFPLVAAAVCALVLPAARAQAQVDTYQNASLVLEVLSTSWSGAGYNDAGDAHYLFRPKEGMTDAECAPQTGRPSKCAVDLLQLELQNMPTTAAQNDTQNFNFTLSIRGDVFESSPGARYPHSTAAEKDTFFEMPAECRYERNHSVLATFNASKLTSEGFGEVEFLIQRTTADILGCFEHPGPAADPLKDICSTSPQPLNGIKVCDRCPTKDCYPQLVGKTFKGRFRLGKKRDTDPAGTLHHLEVVVLFPYKHYGTSSWSDFRERVRGTYSPEDTLPSTITSFSTMKERQIFRYSLYAAPQSFKGPVVTAAKGPEWFRDRRPKILSVDPPFGPEEGGTVVTIKGQEFPEADAGRHADGRQNVSVILQHGKLKVDNDIVGREWGGQERECCETLRVSDSEMLCWLPRTSCLHNNPSGAYGRCAKPGSVFANQTVKLGIKPKAKGYYASTEMIPTQYQYNEPFQSAFPNGIDDFVQYEGEWILEDNDMYGGTFVKNQDRVPGQTQILQEDQTTADRFCCPVCKPENSLSTDGTKSNPCKITIKQLSAGLYDVSVPNFMFPGGRQCKTEQGETCTCAEIGTCDDKTTFKDKVTKQPMTVKCSCTAKVPAGPGVCDSSTPIRNGLSTNTSFEVGIERSTDPFFVMKDKSLSVTSCIDQSGPCKDLSRISIREVCKQLVWSTGKINSFLPAGQTVQQHNWKSDGKCDRRMRCVGGPCMWTVLAEEHKDRTWVPKEAPANAPAAQMQTPPPVFQRRESSPMMILTVEYKNALFDSRKFLQALAKLSPGKDNTGKNTDARRFQILMEIGWEPTGAAALAGRVGSQGAGRSSGSQFEVSASAKCIPEPPLTECLPYVLIIYIVSDGPVGDSWTVSKEALNKRAGEPKGDPELRKLNLMEVCEDLSTIPEKAAEGAPPTCIKVQYPGFLQFEKLDIRTKEEIWAYARVGVTRTGGSDLDVTVDYETIDLPSSFDPKSPHFSKAAVSDMEKYAQGLGVDFTSKQGQLRWLEVSRILSAVCVILHLHPRAACALHVRTSPVCLLEP